VRCVGHSAPAWSRYACAAADHPHVGALNSKDPDRAAALTAEHFQIATLQPWRTALAAADRTQLPVPAGRKLTAPGVTTSSCNVPVDDR